MKNHEQLFNVVKFANWCQLPNTFETMKTPTIEAKSAKLKKFRDRDCDMFNLLTGPGHTTEHIFGIQRNMGKGDCLFLALSQCDILAHLDHREIRKRIVDFATSGTFWEDHGTSMIQQHQEQIRLFRKEGTSSKEQQEAYRDYMSRPQMYGTAAELQIASLCWKFNFSILSFDGNNIFERIMKWKKVETYYDVSNDPLQVDSDAHPWYYFRFSGDPSAGHWELLLEIYLPAGVRMLPVGRFKNTVYDDVNNMNVYELLEVPDKDSDSGGGGDQTTKDMKSVPSFEYISQKQKSLTGASSLLTFLTAREAVPVRVSSSKGVQSLNALKRSRSSSEDSAPKCPECKEKRKCTKEKQKSARSQKKGDKKSSQLSTSKSKSSKSKSSGGVYPDSKKKIKKDVSEDEGESDKSSCSSDSDSPDGKCKPSAVSQSPFLNKRVFITGATNCLGKVLVKRFHEAGAIVFALDTECGELEELGRMYPGITIFLVSNFDWGQSQHCVASAGVLDHLINNSGYLYPKRIWDIEEEDSNHVFDLNFTWLLGISIQFARGIVERKCSGSGGTIVNVSSVFDRYALPGGTLYSCSQAALSALTRSLAVELGRHNIRVNTVKPFLLSNGVEDQFSKYCNQQTTQSLGRYVREMEDKAILQEPMVYDHVCDAIMYLLGPNSRSITGSEISVQAGMMEY